MGIFGRKMRGGAGSNHFSGRMDYPYAGDGTPDPFTSPSPAKFTPYPADYDPFTAPSKPDAEGRVSAPAITKKPSAPEAPATAGPLPSKRYNIQGGGGDYLHVEDVGDNYYSVTRFGASGERQLHSPRAQFAFDAQKKTASWIDSKNPNAYGGRGMDIPISGGNY